MPETGLIGAEELKEAWDVLYKQSEAIFKEHSNIDISTEEGRRYALAHPQEMIDESTRIDEYMKKPFTDLGFDVESMEKFCRDFAARVVGAILAGDVVEEPIVAITLAVMRSITIGAQAVLQRQEDAN